MHTDLYEVDYYPSLLFTANKLVITMHCTLSWFFWKDKLDSHSPNWWHSRVMTDTFINWIQTKPFSLKVAVQLTSWQMFKTSMLHPGYSMSIRVVTLETFQTFMINDSFVVPCILLRTWLSVGQIDISGAYRLSLNLQRQRKSSIVGDLKVDRAFFTRIGDYSILHVKCIYIVLRIFHGHEI